MPYLSMMIFVVLATALLSLAITAAHAQGAATLQMSKTVVEQ